MTENVYFFVDNDHFCEKTEHDRGRLDVVYVTPHLQNIPYFNEVRFLNDKLYARLSSV